MPLNLNERQVGFDTSTLGFPGIGACMGMAIQDSAGLFGFHIMPGDTVKIAEFIKFVQANRNYTGNITHVYGCSRWDERYTKTDGQAKWENEMKEIAKALKFSGPVSGFNASKGTKLKKIDSLFIEFRSIGTGVVSFHYKRTSKVTGPTDYTKVSTDDNLREIDLDRKAMNAAVKGGAAYSEKYHLVTKLKYGLTPDVSLTETTRGNKGDYHRVADKNIHTFQVDYSGT